MAHYRVVYLLIRYRPVLLGYYGIQTIQYRYRGTIRYPFDCEHDFTIWKCSSSYRNPSAALINNDPSEKRQKRRKKPHNGTPENMKIKSTLSRCSIWNRENASSKLMTSSNWKSEGIQFYNLLQLQPQLQLQLQRKLERPSATPGRSYYRYIYFLSNGVHPQCSVQQRI